MKRRILLVDDDLAILLTLKAILEMHGFEVETAVAAGEAICRLKERTYHMIITDMVMEEQFSGFDVIRTARKQPYDPATAILTAHPTLGSDWRDQGAQSLLVKPLGTQDLLRQIEALLIAHEDAKQQRLAARSAVLGIAPDPKQHANRKAS
ncbi:MAG: response regulator [Terriglobales bacterium]|jgi:DNA-binding response OmpR family regulator